jgi:protein-disulfide isomerase
VLLADLPKSLWPIGSDMRTLAAVLTMSMLALLLCPVATAATDVISEDTGKAILEELRQVRTLLEAQQQTRLPIAEQRAILMVSGTDAVIGRADAPVTMVEFTDYLCPYCRRFQGNTFAALKKNFIDTGKVRFVSRNFPLSIHPDARNAAHAVICAGEQNRYWEMRDALFQYSDLGAAKLAGYAANIGLDARKFQNCMQADASARIDSDLREANAIGISATPSFVIGLTTSGEINGERLLGALPTEVFEAKINALLATTASRNKAGGTAPYSRQDTPDFSHGVSGRPDGYRRGSAGSP